MKRITKTNARRLFNKGESIGLCPNKLHPEAFDGAFLCWIERVTQDGLRPVFKDFDSTVRLFKWHNCNDFETGLNASYWVES